MQQQEQQLNQGFAEENGNRNAIGSPVSNEVESELPSQPLPLDGEETEQMQQYYAEESQNEGTTATSFQGEISSDAPILGIQRRAHVEENRRRVLLVDYLFES